MRFAGWRNHMDMVVCVGESCHQNGSELVVKDLKKLLLKENLVLRIKLKGSFCVGECSEEKKVTLKFNGKFYHILCHEAERLFYSTIVPILERNT
jgi:NADH:ubiquinone oxidoreductase subunit E